MKFFLVFPRSRYIAPTQADTIYATSVFILDPSIKYPPLFVNFLFSNVQTIGHQKGWFFTKNIYRFLPLLEHSHLPKLTNYMSLPHSLFSITVITWYY